MAKDTWASREMPILQAIAEKDQAGKTIERISELASATGLPRQLVEAGVRRLLEAEMIEGLDASSFDGFELLEIRLRERGRRSIGSWPNDTDAYAEFVRLLDQRVQAEEDPDERGRFERLREAAKRIGESGVGSLLAEFIKRMALGQ